MSRRRSWVRFLAEGALIVFSVLLALGLSAWYEASQREDLAEVVMERIDAELETNAGKIAYRLPYHRAMHDSLTSLMDARIRFRPDGSMLFEGTADMSDLGIVRGKGLMLAGRFAEDAWQVALSDAVLPEIPPDLLLHLARTYGTQDELVETQRSLLDKFNALAPVAFGEASPGPPIVAFSATLYDLVLREEELRALYAEADSLLAAELAR